MPTTTTSRLRTLIVTLTLAAPVLPALAGCGDSGDGTTAPATEAEKQSVSSYEAEIAKEKAEFKSKKK